MKSLTTTTTGAFNLEGIFTHAGDYAGRYINEADAILESISDRKKDIYADSSGWADIMLNENTGQVFAVWASDMLTTQESLLQYVELEKADCPSAYKDAAKKNA